MTMTIHPRTSSFDDLREVLLADWRASLLDVAHGDGMIAARAMARSLLEHDADSSPAAIAEALQSFFDLEPGETATVMASIAEERALQQAFDLDPEDVTRMTSSALAA